MFKQRAHMCYCHFYLLLAILAYMQNNIFIKKGSQTAALPSVIQNYHFTINLYVLIIFPILKPTK